VPQTSLHPPRPNRFAATLLALVLALLAWSAYRPHDYETWALEVFPAILAIIVLAATYRRFPLTPLAYALIALHAAILIIGGHYTYALVPAGNWLKQALHLERNHYDRLGHFIQGFTPAIIAREVLVRNNVVRRGWWLAFLVFAICMCISACYELVEWAVAEITGGSAASTAFLGTQGDPWDTQEDMAMCGIGALGALATLSRSHDSQLRRFNRAL
jgi:putative membrane protein